MPSLRYWGNGKCAARMLRMPKRFSGLTNEGKSVN
jgi:hypothetical protein